MNLAQKNDLSLTVSEQLRGDQIFWPCVRLYIVKRLDRKHMTGGSLE